MKKSRSQLLGLKPLGRHPSGADYVERSRALEAKIKSGELNGDLLRRAKSYYWQCLRMARKLHALPPKSFNPNLETGSQSESALMRVFQAITAVK